MRFLLVAVAFLWSNEAFAAGRCWNDEAKAWGPCPEFVSEPSVVVEPSSAPSVPGPEPTPAPDHDFTIEGGVGPIVSLSSAKSSAEPTAEIAVGFDVAETRLSPRLDLLGAFRALTGDSVNQADPTTFRSIGLELSLSQPVSDRVRLKPALLVGLETRLHGDLEPLHRAARFGYFGVRFDGADGYLFLGAGGDERLSTAGTDRDQDPDYLPAATASWRLRLRKLTGDLDAYLTGRAVIYLRLGYGTTAAADSVLVGVLVGGGRR